MKGWSHGTGRNMAAYDRPNAPGGLAEDRTCNRAWLQKILIFLANKCSSCSRGYQKFKMASISSNRVTEAFGVWHNWSCWLQTVSNTNRQAKNSPAGPFICFSLTENVFAEAKPNAPPPRPIWPQLRNAVVLESNGNSSLNTRKCMWAYCIERCPGKGRASVRSGISVCPNDHICSFRRRRRYNLGPKTEKNGIGTNQQPLERPRSILREGDPAKASSDLHSRAAELSLLFINKLESWASSMQTPQVQQQPQHQQITGANVILKMNDIQQLSTVGISYILENYDGTVEDYFSNGKQ
ncbi:hypothetical protein C0J52_05513 [Blattella germanica]|nr:hypothetical protein C0J52_05513 [Blattella germanica]